MDWKERDALLREAGPLIEALSRAIRTQTALEVAREKFTGTSFDYFHRDDIEDAENAAIELAHQIKALKPA